MSWVESKKEKRRKFFAKVIASVLSVSIFFLFLFGPVSLYRISHGLDVASKDRLSGEALVFLFGGMAGAALAFLIAYFVLRFLGGYTIESTMNILSSTKKRK